MFIRVKPGKEDGDKGLGGSVDGATDVQDDGC